MGNCMDLIHDPVSSSDEPSGMKRHKAVWKLLAAVIHKVWHMLYPRNSLRAAFLPREKRVKK